MPCVTPPLHPCGHRPIITGLSSRWSNRSVRRASRIRTPLLFSPVRATLCCCNGTGLASHCNSCCITEGCYVKRCGNIPSCCSPTRVKTITFHCVRGRKVRRVAWNRPPRGRKCGSDHYQGKRVENGQSLVAGRAHRCGCTCSWDG